MTKLESLFEVLIALLAGVGVGTVIVAITNILLG